MKLKSFLLLLLVIVSIGTLQAKRYNPYGTDWAFGIHFGGTAFFGDMRSNSSAINNTPFSKYFYKDVRFMGGITLDKWFGPIVGVTGNIQYGQIQGTKETSRAWFEANVFEYNMSLMINLSNAIFGVSRRRHSLIYYTVGVGMTESRSWKYSTIDNHVIGTNGNGHPENLIGNLRPMTEGVVVTGLGVKFFIGNGITISFEGNAHVINTNKLDATPNDNSSFIASLEGYTYFNVGVQYNFGFKGRYSTGYHRKSRYNGNKGSFLDLNTKKRTRIREKIIKQKRKVFNFKKR